MLSIARKNPLVCTIIVLILTELIINPSGEFPLNDDWAYSRVIYNYLHTTIFKLSDWQAVPLIPQLLTGIAITKLFGFSFTLLRFISIISLVLTLVVFDRILIAFKISPIPRLIILLCFTFNPLTLSLSNTFLPDVFTLLLVLTSFLFAVKAFEFPTIVNFFLFTILSLIATLNRQTSLVLPIAFSLIYILQHDKKFKTVLISLIPLLACSLTLTLYTLISKHYHSLPTNYGLQLSHIKYSVMHPDITTSKSVAYYLITSTIMLGLFIAPLSLSNLKQHFTIIKGSVWLKTGLGLYLILIVVKLSVIKNYLPFSGNMFYPFGVGPVIMIGLNTQSLHPVSLIAILFWSILNLLGGLSFYLAMSSIILKSNKHLVSSYTFFVVFITYLLPLCLSYVNDRYLLLLLPFFMIAYIPTIDFKFNKLVLLPAIIVFIIVSTLTTHDYLNINRARWQATDELVKNLQISPRNIDGGFEFNGWYSDGFKNYNPMQQGRWWWVEDDTYIISPALIKGYSIQATIPFTSYVSFRFHNIYVLKRIAGN